MALTDTLKKETIINVQYHLLGFALIFCLKEAMKSLKNEDYLELSYYLIILSIIIGSYEPEAENFFSLTILKHNITHEVIKPISTTCQKLLNLIVTD